MPLNRCCVLSKAWVRCRPAGAGARSARRARGFTLVELMIAMAIVVLMVSVALPAYQSWRNKARGRLAGQEIAAMSVVINQYGADNGGTFPASLADVGLSTKKDPWGNLYEYTNLAATGSGIRRRQDKNINPINTDYDLYSMGPDGVSAKQLDNMNSVDDIVRARNGKFIGLSTDF